MKTLPDCDQINGKKWSFPVTMASGGFKRGELTTIAAHASPVTDRPKTAFHLNALVEIARTERVMFVCLEQ